MVVTGSVRHSMPAIISIAARSPITYAISMDLRWVDRWVKNRTFFFVDFEKVRQQDPVNIEGIVPTDLERAGDFSQSPANLPDPTNPDTATAGIYDPCAGNTDPNFVCPHAQFSDGGILNKIPADKV